MEAAVEIIGACEPRLEAAKSAAAELRRRRARGQADRDCDDQCE
jgi:hypothetical protein